MLSSAKDLLPVAIQITCTGLYKVMDTHEGFVTVTDRVVRSDKVALSRTLS